MIGWLLPGASETLTDPASYGIVSSMGSLTGSKQLPEEWDKPHCFLPVFFLIPPFVFPAYVKCDYLKMKIIISTQQSISEERWHIICVLQGASSQGTRPESSVTFNPYEPDRGSERGERCSLFTAGWSGPHNLPHNELSTLKVFFSAASSELMSCSTILLKVHIFDTMFLHRCLCALIHFIWVQ